MILSNVIAYMKDGVRQSLTYVELSPQGLRMFISFKSYWGPMAVTALLCNAVLAILLSAPVTETVYVLKQWPHA